VGGTYLDAKRRAALQELLYVAQALAVVLRFLVNLEKTETPLVRGDASSSRCARPAAPRTAGFLCVYYQPLKSTHSPVCARVCLCVRARVGGFAKSGADTPGG